MSNIFITGALGFVGYALLNKLNTPNNRIIILVRDHVPKRPVPDTVIYVKGELEDINTLRRIIADYEIDTVYHLASQAIVRTCAADPLSAYMSNVMGTVNLLEAIRTVGMHTVKSVVVSTSDKVYGHTTPPYNEETPFLTKYTYESTKACQDIVCQNYFHNYEVPVKIARCSNIYGPGDPNLSRLIPNTIRRVLNDESPEAFSDVLEYVREYIYIDDAVDALMLINDKGIPGEIFCVGGTEAAPVKRVIDSILQLCGSNKQIVTKTRTASFKEIQSQWIDGSKIKKLGWTPNFSLTRGLLECIKEGKNAS